MSRVSDLRDAIIEELKIYRPDDRIRSFYTPRFPAEYLEEKPIIGVRSAGREVQVLQGPDIRRPTIEIGVFGLITTVDSSSDPTQQNLDSILDSEVQSGDVLDRIAEEIIDLWSPGDGTPDGPLANKGLADHAFREITQTALFDAPQLAEFGQWCSAIQVIYEDTRDE